MSELDSQLDLFPEAETRGGNTRSGAAGSGAERAALKARKDDLYETPPEAVEALLRVERFSGVVWEPACGPGAIARVLRAAGNTVYASDLVDYDSPDQDSSRWDFLLESQLPHRVTAIVTNPPFKLADQFVRQALALKPGRVVMLLRLGFLESARSSDLLDAGSGLRRVHVFSKRLPRMHRAGWTGPKASSNTAFAWYVWKRGFTGKPTIDRI